MKALKGILLVLLGTVLLFAYIAGGSLLAYRVQPTLTEEEKQEQAKLRKEYIASVVGDLRNQLDNTYVLDENENKVKITAYNSKEKEKEAENQDEK